MVEDKEVSERRRRGRGMKVGEGVGGGKLGVVKRGEVNWGDVR